jgi:sialate O-acetylesterase
MDEFSFTVADIFGNHMVLQRHKPINLWGSSNRPQIIRVYLDGTETGRSPVEHGRWQVVLPPMETNRNLTMKIMGENPAEYYTFHDVAVGEVWVAGGQSNMAFLLEYDAEAEDVIPHAYNPDIRFFDCPKIKFTGQEKEDDMSQYGFWRPLNPANAPFYSAAGFYFANKIYQRYHIPIGIIGCNWGGTPAAAWMDERVLRNDPQFAVYVREYEESLQNLDLEQYYLMEKRGREILKEPGSQKIMNTLMKQTPNFLLKPFISFIVKMNDKKQPPIGPRSEKRPGGLYHHMVMKIAPYTARGVIWYQGESDDERADRYASLFSTLIRCWRDTWADALPFLFVQLAPYDRWLGLTAQNFPVLREQQEWVSKNVPDAYMVSIMDAGDKFDIHPKDKRPVGERLALLALGKVYGEDILCEAPEAAPAKLVDGQLVIPFVHVGDGLHLTGERLLSLEIAVDGKEIQPDQVVVDGSVVRVEADELHSAKRLEIEYAFQNYAEVNLYNSAGLPAKPFRQVIEHTA